MEKLDTYLALFDVMGKIEILSKVMDDMIESDNFTFYLKYSDMRDELIKEKIKLEETKNLDVVEHS